MRIAVGTDHGGYPIKDAVVAVIRELGHEVIDHGTDSEDSVDYPDIIEKLGRDIQSGNADLGIALCGSGVGICIAANKMRGVYAAICHDTYSAEQGVEHDNMNVLALAGELLELNWLKNWFKRSWKLDLLVMTKGRSGIDAV